jgi:hypothetical protein
VAPWLVVWLVVGIVSTVALLACLIGLVRHVLILGRTVKAFQEEIQPFVDDLAREGERASETTASMAQRGRGGPSTRPPG